MSQMEGITPREYWTRCMEAASVFMEQMRSYPIKECREEMASLKEAADGLEVCFSETLLAGKYPRVFFIRSGLTGSFREIAREMNERGWILKVEDGYRTPEMQRSQCHDRRIFDVILEKVFWELEGRRPDPAFLLRRVTALVATRCRIGTHISGSALDISVMERDSGLEVERGGSYIEISEKTPMASPFVSEEARKNRQDITAIMQKHGWMAYPYEFWHYSRGDIYAESLMQSGRPGRYGAVRFDGQDLQFIPEAEWDELLEPLAFYEAQIRAALAACRACG